MVSVLLYIPNLIGKFYLDYARLILAIVAVARYESAPGFFVFAYIFSAALDGVDGMAARALHQESNIGMVLDMSIDRLSFMLICMVNAVQRKHEAAIFCTLIALDSISHLGIIMTSLVDGKKTHKLNNDKASWLLTLYYQTHLLFTLCFCSEGFVVASYVITNFGIAGLWVDILYWGLAVGIFVKQLVNVEQIRYFAKDIVDGFSRA